MSSSTRPTTNISTAQSEYYNRPADERFETLGAMLQAATTEREQSHEAIYNLRDLRAITQETEVPSFSGNTTRTNLMLEGPKGAARFTHYSFGQLARTIGAPASYLRTLPPAIAADAINFGLHEAAPVGTKANMLIKDDGNDASAPIIRACTSETYGRIWDAQLYGEVARHFGDGQRSNGGQWMTPPAWPGSLPSGQYRGDRDSFVIRVDGGSIVTDPSAHDSGDGSKMYRGIMLRNSEVGHASISIECVLYRYICGNHMIWGAILDRQFRRRHVGKRITHDTMQELAAMAYKFNTRAASTDEQIIQTLITHELAHTKEAVIDELKKIGATKAEAEAAYTACADLESASPRSFWGVAQGLTRVSQDSGHQDERLRLDQLAAQVLKRGAIQYATV